MSASAITGILDGRSLRGVTGARGVWRIRGGGRIGSNLQESLLEAVCREASPYVYYDEAPPTEEVFAGIRANHDGCWQVPQGAHGTDLLKWLYAGNWQLLISKKPPRSLPDLCRASDDEVRAFMGDESVPLIIDAFHDNHEWTIGCSLPPQGLRVLA